MKPCSYPLVKSSIFDHFKAWSFYGIPTWGGQWKMDSELIAAWRRHSAQYKADYEHINEPGPRAVYLMIYRRSARSQLEVTLNVIYTLGEADNLCDVMRQTQDVVADIRSSRKPGKRETGRLFASFHDWGVNGPRYSLSVSCQGRYSDLRSLATGMRRVSRLFKTFGKAA